MINTGSVSALQPSPALSLLAIAWENGTASIHDVRIDKEIIRLGSSGQTHISSISFRADGLGAGEDGRKAGVLATAGPKSGDVTLWDLNEGGRVMGVLRDAHSPPSSSRGPVLGGINKVEFLAGQAVLVSGGLDNALRTWIFDETPFSPVPRMLHSRTGHAAPVGRLEFLPAEADGADSIGKWLLSAGRDRSLWGWSIRRDAQSTELSQGNVKKKARKLGTLSNGLDAEHAARLEDLKAPEITCIACSLNRDGGMGTSTGGGSVWANVQSKKGNADVSDNGPTGWESVLTGHRGDKLARTWFWGRKKAGRWAFETSDSTEVKVWQYSERSRTCVLTLRQSVAISPCGTFAFVGSANGGIDMFNVQSGIHRQNFPSPLTPAQARKLKIMQANESQEPVSSGNSSYKYSQGEGKHTKAVTGIMVDGLNRTVISCSLDGKIKFWDFLSGMLLHEIDWFPMAAITASRYHRPSDLVALSCDDLSIRIVDIETRRLVRELWGCIGQISDFCFSNDGRWIIAASMDSAVRVWDLPTGHLIDVTPMQSSCTAIAFSKTGEFLATAHADSVGIDIWTNRTLFAHVPTHHISQNETTKVVRPTASGEGGEGLLDAAFDEEPNADQYPDALPSSADQLSDEMMTLSLVPRSRWQTLLHLDTIAQRNKPIEPPKAPEKAPFFLFSREGLDKAAAATTTQDPPKQIQQPTPHERSRIFKIDRKAAQSEFTTLLHSYTTSNDFTPFIEHLKTLPPAAADVQIRSLNPLASSTSPDENTNEFVTFVSALTFRLRQKRDYELVQAWMAVFLRVHGELVPRDKGLVEALKVWKAVMEEEGKRLEKLVGYCAGVMGFLRSGR